MSVKSRRNFAGIGAVETPGTARVMGRGAAAGRTVRGAAVAVEMAEVPDTSDQAEDPGAGGVAVAKASHWRASNSPI